MTTSRKHYRQAALALNAVLRRGTDSRPRSEFSRGVGWTVDSVALDLAHMFKEDNIHFDKAKFLEAVYDGVPRLGTPGQDYLDRQN